MQRIMYSVDTVFQSPCQPFLYFDMYRVGSFLDEEHHCCMLVAVCLDRLEGR